MVFTRTVMVLLVHQDEFLLLFHKNHRCWMGPGGHIEPGELDHEAAQRELEEETGLVINLATKTITSRSSELPRPFRVHSYKSDGKLELDYTFVLEVDKDIRSTPLNPKEGHKLGWISISLVPHLIMYKDTRIQLSDILQGKHLGEATL